MFDKLWSLIVPSWDPANPTPQLGEHSEDVLLGIGYSPEDIEEFSKKKVI